MLVHYERTYRMGVVFRSKRALKSLGGSRSEWAWNQTIGRGKYPIIMSAPVTPAVNSMCQRGVRPGPIDREQHRFAEVRRLFDGAGSARSSGSASSVRSCDLAFLGEHQLTIGGGAMLPAIGRALDQSIRTCTYPSPALVRRISAEHLLTQPAAVFHPNGIQIPQLPDSPRISTPSAAATRTATLRRKCRNYPSIHAASCRSSRLSLGVLQGKTVTPVTTYRSRTG